MLIWNAYDKSDANLHLNKYIWLTTHITYSYWGGVWGECLVISKPVLPALAKIASPWRKKKEKDTIFITVSVLLKFFYHYF